MKKIILSFFAILLSFFVFYSEVNAEDTALEGVDIETIFFDSSEFDVNCVYKGVNGGLYKVAFNVTGESKTGGFPSSTRFFTKNSNPVTAQYYKQRHGKCPKKISRLFVEVTSGQQAGQSYTAIYFNSDKGTEEIPKYKFREYEGELPQLIVEGDVFGKTTCAEILGEDGVNLLKTIKNLIMIFVPILLVVLAVVDVVSATFSGDENNMKKAQGKLVKRVIIAVVIFLIPVLLGFILDIVNMIWPNIDADLCGIF